MKKYFYLFILPLFAEDINSVLSKALEHNPAVLSALAEQDANELEAKKFLSKFMPEIDVEANYGWQKKKQPIESDRMNYRLLSLIATQNLYNGLQDHYGYKQVVADLHSKSYATKVFINDICQKISVAYVNVLLDRKRLEYADSNLQALQKINSLIESRVASGIGQDLEKVEALGRLSVVRTNFLSAQSNLRNSEYAFYQLTGFELGEAADNIVIDDRVIPVNVDTAVHMAINSNYSLKSSQYDIASANAGLQSVSGYYLPKLDTDFTYDYNKDFNEAGVKEEYKYGLKLRWNLFRGGHDIAKVKQNAYKYEKSKQDNLQKTQDIVYKTKSSWNNYNSSSAQLSYRKSHIAALMKSKDVYYSQFRLGQRSLMDLLDSENEVIRAQNAFLDTQRDMYVAYFSLLSDTGLLAEVLAVSPDYYKDFHAINSSSIFFSS